jgi:hypothetical protein
LDGDIAASAASGIGLDAAAIEHHQGRIDDDVTAAAGTIGH